jgi:hypothetical protein
VPGPAALCREVVNKKRGRVLTGRGAIVTADDGRAQRKTGVAAA